MFTSNDRSPKRRGAHDVCARGRTTASCPCGTACSPPLRASEPTPHSSDFGLPLLGLSTPLMGSPHRKVLVHASPSPPPPPFGGPTSHHHTWAINAHPDTVGRDAFEEENGRGGSEVTPKGEWMSAARASSYLRFITHKGCFRRRSPDSALQNAAGGSERWRGTSAPRKNKQRC